MGTSIVHLILSLSAPSSTRPWAVSSGTRELLEIVPLELEGVFVVEVKNEFVEPFHHDLVMLGLVGIHLVELLIQRLTEIYYIRF